ncbi:MAG: hypothetical protein K6L60_03475 [Oceanobacter sp.]
MKLITVALALFLVGCLSNSSDLDVEPSFNKAIALNGFWDGQFNQNGAVRFLFYDGAVFGTDGTSGYRGTVSYDEPSEKVSVAFSVYGLTTSETNANYYVSGGNANAVSFDGLLVNQSTSTGTIVGNYVSASEGGSLTLVADGSWANGSALWQLVGTWQAGAYRLFVAQRDGSNTFIGTGPNGCSFEGNIYLLNSKYPLFAVNMFKRENCSGFNLSDGQSADGFTALNINQQLEMYLALNDEQLIMRFSK